MKCNSLTYSLNIWLTSVVVAPVLFLIVTSTMKGSHLINAVDVPESISICCLLMLVQLIFSLLTWLLFMLIIKAIVNLCDYERLWKPLIFITGILLTAGSFRAVFSDIFSNADELFYLMLCNCVCIGAGTLFYKLKSIIPVDGKSATENL
ncbi:hypothetical protein [Mucilaginibacter xinganensis]|uniref:Transmembrane protein n=1 Tax=Mucilaginibacter xinganensis TaxID=1234841 RepID=A0A223P1W2_9SPHI|nr:hypothetical protein [Mucilaginibacter xinganensis]ASU35808.1 hypothetical protein MuYL_3923 [Mucilaginibacter xinganensis]